jgi:hypothetical protein
MMQNMSRTDKQNRTSIFKKNINICQLQTERFIGLGLGIMHNIALTILVNILTR